ncbi:ATP-grasp domain-containing protein [Rhodovulum sp. DZ06]|uniref:ATP-grasp domain-containing protein n=1 Tax=Rhodovulum sp. DZ06 TaxID=3425126 RepID=UPI003D353A05
MTMQDGRRGDPREIAQDPGVPAVTRHAAAAAAEIGARMVLLDLGGWLFRIERDGRRFTSGAGAVCAFPVNSAAAHSLARDKQHSATILRADGQPAIPGRLFFARTDRFAALRPPGATPADALAFAAEIGWPVFCKPNTGSRGDFAERVEDAVALSDYIARLREEHDGFLVQSCIAGEELRVAVFDGEAVYEVHKAEPALVGDGARTVAALLAAENAALAAQGLSPWPGTALSAPPESVPEAGARVPLSGRRNLSASGETEEVTDAPDPEAAALAIRAAAALGLRFAAVDLFDHGPGMGHARFTIIELNGNPGMEALERAGRSDIILSLWTRMLEEALA